MHGFIEPFYEAVEKEERKLAPGHVYADQPVYLPPKRGLTISRVDPQDDRRLNYELGGRTDEIFSHAPIKSLDLPSNEGLLVANTKRNRPVIVLGGTRGQEVMAGHDRARLLDAAICVPVYGGDQFRAGMRERIRAYEFENFFYLPADAGLKFDEGFARLDHAQPILRTQLRAHRGLKLSDEALEALAEWYIYFVTGQIDEGSLLLAYRSEQRVRLAGGEE